MFLIITPIKHQLIFISTLNCSRGVATYETGGRYEGDWEADARHGWGTQSFPGGDSYEGEWAQDKINGRGRWTYADSSYYQGEWKDGEKVEGRWVSADGSEEYSGSWKDDERSGQGVQYRAKMSKYDGGWVRNLEHGKGRCEWADGSVYEGDWKEGKMCGKGHFSAGKMRYNGEYRDGKPHGEGIFLEDTGDRFMGSFVEGQRSGFGRCLYADGSKYEGQWKAGKRWGQGSCVYANGDVYKGEWERDQRHGLGVCRFADGSKFKGRWEEDGWVQSGADPAQCYVAGAGVTRGSAGKRAVFKILAKDEDGNQRLSGGDEFQVLLQLFPENGIEEEEEEDNSTIIGFINNGGDSTLVAASQLPKSAAAAKVAVAVAVTGDVKDCEDGTYEVSYVATVAGVYELSIKIGEFVCSCLFQFHSQEKNSFIFLLLLVGATEHVADSPYPVRILPAAPYPRRTQIIGPGRSQAVSGTTSGFDILLHDEFGNRCTGPLSVPIEAYLQGPSGYKISVSLPNTDVYGRFMCFYQAPELCGLYRLHVEWGGAPLPGTPFSVSVVSTTDANTFEQQDVSDTVSVDSIGTEGDALLPLPLPRQHQQQQKQRHEPFIKDEMAAWERIAATAYAADGVTDGWDSDEEEKKKRKKENSEEAYLTSHPNVPVVENLEDLWMVSKLQKERKDKEENEKRKKLVAVRERLEGEFGPGVAPTAEEAETALKEILKDEAEKNGAGEESGEMSSDTSNISGGGGVNNGSRRHKPTRAELLATAAAHLDEILS